LAGILTHCSGSKGGAKIGPILCMTQALFPMVYLLAPIAGLVGGLPLYELVQVQLSPFAARAVITGEPLVVGGAFAQSFALIVHELATNAVKHGALSAPGGRLAIDWKIDRSSRPVLLKFSWIERGGPAAKPPDEQGLGMQLMALVGQSAITFNDEGLEYALTLPLEEALRGRDEPVLGVSASGARAAQ
jgi:hypothetical protein